MLEVNTQLDCAPELNRDPRGAVDARAPDRLPDGWVCGRRCDVGGPVGEPVVVDYVLMHPRLGIALIDLREPIHDAAAFLLQRLEETGFNRIFAGHLPVMHGVLRDHDLPAVTDLLDAAFAELPPLTIGGGEAWVRMIERTVVPGDRIWTDNLEGAPRGWRDDGHDAFQSIPPIVTADHGTGWHGTGWNAAGWRDTAWQAARRHLAVAAERARLVALAARQVVRTEVAPRLRLAAAAMPGRIEGARALLSPAADVFRRAAGATRPVVAWSAAGASGVALIALLTMSWSTPAPVAALAALPEALTTAQPTSNPGTPDMTPATLAASADPVPAEIAEAATPAVAALPRPAPRRVSYTPPRQASLAEQRQDAARARRAAARARAAESTSRSTTGSTTRATPREQAGAQREARPRG